MIKILGIAGKGVTI